MFLIFTTQLYQYFIVFLLFALFSEGMLICQRRFADCSEFRVLAHAPGRSIIFSNNVLLVIADIILKRVVNYIYIPIYSTISRIPTTLRYSPLLLVTKNGKVEIITTDQSDATFGLNPAEVSGFYKSALAYSPARLVTKGVFRKEYFRLLH